MNRREFMAGVGAAGITTGTTGLVAQTSAAPPVKTVRTKILEPSAGGFQLRRPLDGCNSVGGSDAERRGSALPDTPA